MFTKSLGSVNLDDNRMMTMAEQNWWIEITVYFDWTIIAGFNDINRSFSETTMPIFTESSHVEAQRKSSLEDLLEYNMRFRSMIARTDVIVICCP